MGLIHPINTIRVRIYCRLVLTLIGLPDMIRSISVFFKILCVHLYAFSGTPASSLRSSSNRDR